MLKLNHLSSFPAYMQADIQVTELMMSFWSSLQ